MTATERDVVRRRRRWLAGQLVLVACTAPSVAWIWWQVGALAGAIAMLLWINVCLAVWRNGIEYRRGYWIGRSDVHAERTARMLGIEPVSCQGAEPWSPPRDDGELIDEIRFAMRRRTTSLSNEQHGEDRA